MTGKEHIVLWKYTVQPEHRETFEREYGKNGTWYQLFSTSKFYKGSFLYKDGTPNTYLLIDAWEDEASYQAFKENNEESYNTISSKFEVLYDKEEKIGVFNGL